MLIKAYVAVIASTMIALAIWFGIDFLAEGLGPSYGMGFCSGVMVTFAILFFRALLLGNFDRDDKAKPARLSPIGRPEQPVADLQRRDRLPL